MDEFLLSVSATHPLVQAAQAETQAAQAEVEGAHRQMYPEFQVSTASPVNHSSNSTLVSQPKMTLALEQKLWAAGRYTATIQASESAAQASLARLREARLNAALNAVEALQGFRAASQKLQVMQKTSQRLAGFVRMMERRVAEKVSAPIDVALINSRMVQSKIDQANAQAAKNVAITRLQQLGLGAAAVDWGAVQVAHLGEPLSEGIAKNADDAMRDMDDAVARFPSVIRAEHEADVAQRRYEATAAERFPAVFARVEQSHYDNPNNAAQSGVVFAYIGLRYSPGGGLANLSTTKAAAEKAQSVRLQSEASQRDVRNQMYQDWEEWRNAIDRQGDYQVAIKSAEAVSESYERQFIVGRLSWQQTLDAVKELGQMGVAMADTESSLWAASYRLKLRQGLYSLADGEEQ